MSAPKRDTDLDEWNPWHKASYFAFGLMSISVVRSPFMQRGDLALKYADSGFSLTRFQTEAENVPRGCGVRYGQSLQERRRHYLCMY